MNRFEIWSKPRPTSDTTTGSGVTLDFEKINYRGMELQIRYVNTQTGAWEDGPRVNPYCSLCAG